MTGHYPAAYFVLLYIASVMTSVAAMATHIITCIKAGSIGFMILGVLLPFVGVIHGWGIWLGLCQ
ncbi:MULTISPECIES: hypothetical protein [unclassified Bradyrhizobium]|uniref:hypothetical protein n=1 Tax=unclassified Bradyrhizobium TaxID=2631580 RepID=UPI0029163986|nr:MULTISPECIES: hypothetical protein [unclassified Bradyrhizobium]